jgi:hypothetical protein
MKREKLPLPGPFQWSLDHATPSANSDTPLRQTSCAHYEECLDLAAALNWDGFTCEGCNHEINSTLVWRAHLSARKDALAKSMLCSIRPLIAIRNPAK